ncbi:myocardin isoform x1 [Limosa lapponica baueri]|uniref:Myocardin isoform x1 n=1 Tax=Limosa lapponica baueri TaxID=1758121 RepID=A0A2I0UDI2_LIMLA|nr:myocardin isoform x1 [Limosa lapponica baueri]
MNGVIKQDRSDHKSAPSGNEEEKASREKAASEVRDGTKLQPPPFAERKNDNLVFSKIASDQCIREQNLAWASASVICGSLVMGPETSLPGRC